MRATKDSGFEWIGIIPSEWGLSRIGQVYRLRNTKVSDTDYPPLSVTNKGIVPQLDTAAKTNAHDDRKLVKKGDFAINSRSDIVLTDEARAEFPITMVLYRLSILSWHH